MVRMPEENYNEELLEDSEYSRKSEFSKATLVQAQVGKCMELRSKDMRPGYTTWVNDKPVIIPDSRKEFVGAIESLKNLLAPEADLKMEELEDDWNKAKEKIFTKYAYKEKKGKKELGNGKYIWIYSGNTFIPQKGASLMCINARFPNSEKVSYTVGIWDAYVDAYWDELVLIADELFAELNRLIHILDYFKGGMSF